MPARVICADYLNWNELHNCNGFDQNHWFPGSISGRELHMVGSNCCLRDPSPATDLDEIMACKVGE